METKFKPNYAIHPGVLLADDLKTLKMSQKELSKRISVSKTTINEIIKGKRNINADFAVRLELVMDLPASFWLDAQSFYDETNARLKIEKEACFNGATFIFDEGNSAQRVTLLNFQTSGYNSFTSQDTYYDCNIKLAS